MGNRCRVDDAGDQVVRGAGLVFPGAGPLLGSKDDRPVSR
jgi:hypothetical protein